ncbi:MAG: class I SAM-dependent methyltransferase [Elainella sp.]
MTQLQPSFQSPEPADLVETCPICSNRSRRLFSKYGYWVRGCLICGHQFAELHPDHQHVATVYSDSYFQGGGAGYPNYLAEAKLLRRQGRRYARILTRYMQPGLMLDVGAAAGLILQGFADYGWDAYGLEPNRHMAEFAQTQLGLSVRPGTLENFHSPDRYDLITLIQVVPHFYDLHQAFQVASQHTAPNGFWLIETWNRSSLTARLFGQNWHEYSPPSVLHWFSAAGLQRLAAQYGFVEVARGRPAKWINVAHAKSLLRYRWANTSLRGALRLLDIVPDRLNLPYPAEDLFWMLLQKR